MSKVEVMEQLIALSTSKIEGKERSSTPNQEKASTSRTNKDMSSTSLRHGEEDNTTPTSIEAPTPKGNQISFGKN